MYRNKKETHFSMCLLLVEMTGCCPPCLARHPIPHFLRHRTVFAKNSVKQGATGFNPDSLPPPISVFVQIWEETWMFIRASSYPIKGTNFCKRYGYAAIATEGAGAAKDITTPRTLPSVVRTLFVAREI